MSPAAEPAEPRASLSSGGEREWDRLRSEFDMARSSWLGWVFASSAEDAAVLEHRVRGILRNRMQTVRSYHPSTPADLIDVTSALMAEAWPDDCGCVWVEAVRVDSPGLTVPATGSWTDAWQHLLLRLNDHRDAVLRRANGALVLVAPVTLKAMTRDAAPDLWSVRSIVVELPAVERTGPVDQPTAMSRPQRGNDAPAPSWAVVPDAEPVSMPSAGALDVLRQATTALASGRPNEAREQLRGAAAAYTSGSVEEASVLALLAAADEAVADDSAALDHARHALRSPELPAPARTRALDLTWRLAERIGAWELAGAAAQALLALHRSVR